MRELPLPVIPPAEPPAPLQTFPPGCLVPRDATTHSPALPSGCRLGRKPPLPLSTQFAHERLHGADGHVL